MKLNNINIKIDSVTTAISIIAAKITVEKTVDMDTTEFILKQLYMAEIIEQNFKKIFSELKEDDAKRLKRKRIGDILLEQGSISVSDLEYALKLQEQLK